jgi:hypothetical protein
VSLTLGSYFQWSQRLTGSGNDNHRTQRLLNTHSSKVSTFFFSTQALQGLVVGMTLETNIMRENLECHCVTVWPPMILPSHNKIHDTHVLYSVETNVRGIVPLLQKSDIPLVWYIWYHRCDWPFVIGHIEPDKMCYVSCLLLFIRVWTWSLPVEVEWKVKLDDPKSHPQNHHYRPTRITSS